MKPKQRSPSGHCRGIGVSLTPEDEAYLKGFNQSWAEAVRAVIQESRFWRAYQASLVAPEHHA